MRQRSIVYVAPGKGSQGCGHLLKDLGVQVLVDLSRLSRHSYTAAVRARKHDTSSNLQLTASNCVLYGNADYDTSTAVITTITITSTTTLPSSCVKTQPTRHPSDARRNSTRKPNSLQLSSKYPVINRYNPQNYQ